MEDENKVEGGAAPEETTTPAENEEVAEEGADATEGEGEAEVA